MTKSPTDAFLEWLGSLPSHDARRIATPVLYGIVEGFVHDLHKPAPAVEMLEKWLKEGDDHPDRVSHKLVMARAAIEHRFNDGFSGAYYRRAKNNLEPARKNIVESHGEDFFEKNYSKIF